MRLTSRWKSGLAALVAVGSVFGASAVSDVANALPAGTAPENGGGLAIFPSSGSATTPLQIRFDPNNQACPGDNTSGWVYTPFISEATDVAPLTFSTAGSPQSIAGERTTFFRDTGGNIIRNIFPSLNNFLVNDVSNVSLSQSFYQTGQTPLTPGTYTVGVACQNPTADFNGTPARENAKFWTTQITVLDGAGAWIEGLPEAAPAAPVITGVNGTVASFTAAVANPDITGFTATVTPTSPAGPALPPIAVPAGATTFDMPGLSLGSSYEVSMIATNAIGDSAVSNVFSFTVQPPAPAVTAFDIFSGDSATVNWTVPAGAIAPVSYDVEIVDASSAVVQSFPGETGTSVVVSGLAVGDYTAEVTANYPAGSGLVGPTGSDAFSVLNNALIVQEVSVTRPPGALIITQRCGVFGPLNGFTAVDAFPGFPSTLGARNASANQVGTSPDIDLATPGVQPDPEFDNYPFPTPATYPTECGLDMGTASFVTSGALAGQFYEAGGRLNQVTVLDTRDNDDGWVARGDIEDVFTGDTGDTFDGDYLGWVPQVTGDSDPVGGSTYDQVVTAGPQVLPGTTGGLTGNAELASAPSGAGLGIATLDARMLLLIPASADAADYNATLTLTVA